MFSIVNTGGGGTGQTRTHEAILLTPKLRDKLTHINWHKPERLNQDAGAFSLPVSRGCALP
jgi:hypothetical protein